MRFKTSRSKTTIIDQKGQIVAHVPSERADADQIVNTLLAALNRDERPLMAAQQPEGANDNVLV